MYVELYADFIRMMHDLAQMAAWNKVARKQAYSAVRGRCVAEMVRGRQDAIRYRSNMRRIQMHNNKMAELRRHHRTTTR